MTPMMSFTAVRAVVIGTRQKTLVADGNEQLFEPGQSGVVKARADMLQTPHVVAYQGFNLDHLRPHISQHPVANWAHPV